MTITKPNGETTVTTVRVWNETVSNLTLMALGSSAPEILLSVIEVQTTYKMLLIYYIIIIISDQRKKKVSFTVNVFFLFSYYKNV